MLIEGRINNTENKMEISFTSYHECNILESILKEYEEGKESHRADFDHVIGSLKASIDKFKIGQIFDYIGPLSCASCHHEWIAVIGETALSMPCPKCEKTVSIPPEKFVRKIR